MGAKANVVEPVRGPSTLVRPRFSPGLLLRDDDLSVGVGYTRELSRLLFRSLFGCGVVCGLVVIPKVSCGKLVVTVGSGVALNCTGDPIHVPQPVQVCIDPCAGKRVPSPLWVTLCLTEKCCAPRSAVCGCDDEDVATVCTREQQGFEIRIVSEDPRDCDCGCRPGEQSAQAAAARVASPAAAGTNVQPARPGRSGSRAARAAAPVMAPRRAAEPWWADPCSNCYKDHYAGKCGCECCDGACVVLAVLTRTSPEEEGEIGTWQVRHDVRRFVRPMLIRDPQVWIEQHPDNPDPCKPPEPTEPEPTEPEPTEPEPTEPEPTEPEPTEPPEIG